MSHTALDEHCNPLEYGQKLPLSGNGMAMRYDYEPYLEPYLEHWGYPDCAAYYATADEWLKIYGH